MKIYFAGSICGGREKQKEYSDLISFISKYGEVLTEHVGKLNTDIKNECRYSEKEDEHVYIRDAKWLDECDILIAEISIPSLGVGYEIGYAESKNKEIICLYDTNSEKGLSYMVSGNINNKIIKYSQLNEARSQLEQYFKNRNNQ